MRRLCAPLVAAAVLALLAGSSTAAEQSASRASARTPEQQRMAAVILRWSMRLNDNDNEVIARLYALPALIVQGAYAYRLVNRHQVALWYSGLPCSGTIVRIVFHGRFATAVFSRIAAAREGGRAEALPLECKRRVDRYAAVTRESAGTITLWTDPFPCATM